MRLPALLLIAILTLRADSTKDASLRGNASVGQAPTSATPSRSISTTATAGNRGAGHRFAVRNGEVEIPVVVVRGTPFEMGRQLGQLMRKEIAQLAPAAVAGFKQELKVDDATLDLAWATTAGYTDPRVLQQLVGLAEGSGQPVRLLQHVHCLPLLMPYSCSSIAAWGKATEDGHLYQTRNLDWSLRAGAHEFPVIVVYLPSEGLPHATPSFAGFIGAHCGLNAAGVVLSEIGDASAKEMPYNLHAPHFTAWFRTLLYDADTLSETLDLFGRIPPTKRYHFVFGDGRTDRRSVKIRAATGGGRARPEIDIWKDNDASDELAPKVLSCAVYHDEDRGVFPALSAGLGRLNGERMIALANSIPIQGGNVMNAVFDATGLRLWVSYARGDKEAYQRPYVFLDLAQLDVDGDSKPDFAK